MEKIVFLGVNHSGTIAINKILKEDKNKNYQITAYEMNNNCSFLGCGIALWISGVVKNPNDLFYSSKKEMEDRGGKIYMDHQVLSVDFKAKILTIKELKTGKIKKDNYDKLVISVGSRPIIPPFVDFEKNQWKNIITIKTFQDSQWIIDKLKNPKIKKVSIVGGGYIGVELAEAARLYGKEVTLIDNSDRIVNRYYDQEFTDILTAKMKKEGINFELNQLVEDLNGKDGIVHSLKTNKKEIETDLILFAIGAVPNTKWLQDKNLKMLPNGAIIVDQHQQTSIKNVYSIGDCATIYNNAKQKDDYIALASNAIKTGEIIGDVLLGRKTPFFGVQGSNGISIYGFNLVSTGLTKNGALGCGFDAEESYLEAEQKPKFMNDPHKVMIKIVYDKNNRRLLGAQIASTYDISLAIHMFSLAIAKKTTIDELKYTDLFFLPRFNDTFNYLNEVAMKIK